MTRTYKRLNIGVLILLGLTAYGLSMLAYAASPAQPGAAHASQSTKTRTLKGYGLTVNIRGQQVYVDGKPAALDANDQGNLTYSQGLNTFIVYKSGKVALMQSGRFMGYMK